jgi:hypothetical protein
MHHQRNLQVIGVMLETCNYWSYDCNIDTYNITILIACNQYDESVVTTQSKS